MAEILSQTQPDFLSTFSNPVGTSTSLQQGLSGIQPQAMHPVVRAVMQAIGALPNDQLTSIPQQGVSPSVAQAWLGSIPKSKGELALQMALPLIGMAAGPVMKGLAGLGGEAAETAPTFYSNVLDAFSNPKLPNKLTREQALSVLNSPGVKSEENKWLDLPNFLNSKDKWNRGDIQDYIRQNQISVSDVKLAPPTTQYQVDWTRNPIDDDMFKNWRRQEYQAGNLTKNEDGSYVHSDRQFANLSPPQLRGVAHEALWRNQTPGLNYPDYAHQEFSTAEEAQQFKDQLPQSSDPEYTVETIGGDQKYSQYTLPGGKNYREVLLKWDNPRVSPDQPQQFGLWNKPGEYFDRTTYPTQEEAQAALSRREQVTQDLGGRTGNLEVRSKSETPPFVGGHFEEPNILAHLRLTDRTTPDGKKVLFMEEAQSDWQKQLRESDKSSGNLDERGSWEYEASKLMHDKGLGNWAPLSKYDTENVEKFGNRYGDLPGESLSSYRGEPVPEAPLARNYPELAMKRVLRMAAEQGYDSVGWTTGKQQADRYNQTLLQSVKGVTYDPSTQELIAETPQGPKSYITPVEQLPGFVGKDAARKLIQGVEVSKPGVGYHIQTVDGDNVNTNSFPTREEAEAHPYYSPEVGDMVLAHPTPGKVIPARLEGSDLQLGERGYSELYDKQLPSIADKWGKKFGARVSQEPIEIKADNASLPIGRTTVHMIPITPALKQSALAKGFPLFAVGGAAGLAAMNRERLARERNRNTEPDTYVMH